MRACYIAGVLLVARIMWGLTRTGYACFCSFLFDPRQAIKHIYHVLKGNAKRYIGHNPAGSLVIYAMLVTGLTAVGSGWLVLVTIHVIGVVTESILHKDNLIRAMITGCKRVTKKTRGRLNKILLKTTNNN
jgi:cytochrome b